MRFEELQNIISLAGGSTLGSGLGASGIVNTGTL